MEGVDADNVGSELVDTVSGDEYFRFGSDKVLVDDAISVQNTRRMDVEHDQTKLEGSD
jgi:hypothetical protein